ncbi:MAG: 3-hydroxyacyl-CoA dehydrogenase/enoyl-CoA hydratase family protein [Thermodesulfobacteriota bacterium]|nr:3-hydroxyacyl-CoA dehydrogenase/enoyl-CoA hydratase family protein [Thermodesulfobacteriota bacterium]
MNPKNPLYRSYLNPLLISSDRPIPREIAIIGAGTIGPDIGYYLKSALPGIYLYLVDVAEKPLEAAEKRINGYIQKAIDRKKMKPDMAERVGQHIIYTTDYAKIKNCDLVIEAATENIPLKQKIFSDVEALIDKDAIITSNTSSIPADRLFNNMRYPARTTVTHFFAPAWRSLPVEVIAWEGGSRETLDYLFWFFAVTGKVPIITDNAICFMLDRIFDNWCNEAACLLEHATAAQIDSVAREFVFAGPFFVLNMAHGNPIIVETNTLQMEEGAHYQPASIFNSVDRWQTLPPGKTCDVPEKIDALIRDRLLGILFSQSFDIIDRGIGTRADLNFGCQVALGFKKGPLDIMHTLGDSEVSRIMNRFESERPGFPQARQSLDHYQDFKRHILVDDKEGVKIITLRRPQAMNALSDEVTDEILGVLKAHADDQAVTGFIITGYGTGAFSAGADIGKFPEMLGDRAASAQYAKDCAKVQVFMDQMQKPVVAAVNGLALGGGLEVAIRCHRIVAVRTARFQFPEITLGILPGIGGCIVPYRKWPRGAALFHEMICLGRPLTVREAADIGMIDDVADDYSGMIRAALAAVKEMGERVPAISEGSVEIPPVIISEQYFTGETSLSREAVAITTRTIEKGAAADNLNQALEIGYNGFAEIACTEAAREGISAFLGKREPRFTK